MQLDSSPEPVKQSLSVKQEKSSKLLHAQNIQISGENGFMPASKFLRPPASLQQPQLNPSGARLIDKVNSPQKNIKDGVPMQLIAGLNVRHLQARPHLNDENGAERKKQ